MGLSLKGVLIGLQAFHVAFLWLHDWVPLGGLNDVHTVRTVDSHARLLTVTVISSVPFTFGLGYSLLHTDPWAHWFYLWLVISYGLLFLGQLRAWWLPYLAFPTARRAERYRVMFAGTHAFLPMRNGIVPNTLHVMLHVTTVATLLVLYWGAPWSSH